MATFKSEAIHNAYRARPVYDGVLHTYSRSITFPSGTLIASGDTIRFMRIDPSKLVVTRLFLDISGNLDGHATLGSRTLTGKMGYLRSADVNGTNLSFTLHADTGAVTTTPATENDDGLLITTTAPLLAGSVASVTNFGGGSGVGQLASGGWAFYNTSPLEVAMIPDRGDNTGTGTATNIAYSANVMDIAITATANSSTATTKDIVAQLTIEFATVSTSPSSVPPYRYRDRYSSAGVSSV